MNKAYLGLGTNMGNRENYLRKAVEIIKELLDNNLETKQREILNEALIAIEQNYDADKAAELIGGIV